MVSITFTRATPGFPWKSKTIFTSYNTTYLDTTLVLIGQISIDYSADKLIEIAPNYLFHKSNIPNVFNDVTNPHRMLGEQEKSL